MAHSDFKIEQTPAQPVLAVRIRTRIDDLPRVIGQSYMAIMQYLGELGEHPAGPPYTAYYNLDMQDLDVEMGFPVDKALPGKETVFASEIPAGHKVSCMYKGPYSQMESAYEALNRYAAEQGAVPSGVAYEIYFNGPETPEEDLLTQIVFPLL